MTLNDALRRENNNFDVLRLIAACAVIIAHAHALVPGATSHDVVQTSLDFDDAGSLAVKFFFFLSGLVVTNSLIEKPDIAAFGVARIFRLMPGLIVCVLVTALVLGPAVSSLSLTRYFSDAATWYYVMVNILLVPHTIPPGVFTNLRIVELNGSLWTLPFEVLCYGTLAALGLLRVLRYRRIASVILVIVIAYAILSYAVTVYEIDLSIQLPTFVFRRPGARLLPACFAFGALLALNKHIVHVRFWVLSGLVVLCAAIHGTGAFQFVFYATLFYGSIFAATTGLLKRLRPPGDFSYGVYLWGFPLQQLMIFLWPHWTVHENQAAALTAALIVGCCSWYLIERPAIAAGRRLGAWVSRFAVSRFAIFATVPPAAPLADAPPGRGTTGD